ncbi:MAG TPA: extracellular solute-binding protein [Firmicutes bacterium]|nr:extracellular solute-binding protein [Bacillota bacterium]
MKRLFVIILLLVSFVIQASAAAAAKTKIVVLVRNNLGDMPEAVVQAFEQANEDITVELIETTIAEIDQKFLLMAASGQPLDVIISLSLAGWCNYAARGMFLDLESFVERDKDTLIAKGVPSQIPALLKMGDKVTSVAYMLWASFVTNYNATYFEEAGLPQISPNWRETNWTWDAMVAAAKKLSRYNADGRLARAGVATYYSDIHTQNYTLMWGGDLFPPETYNDNIVRDVTFYTPENRVALSNLVALATEHKVSNQTALRVGSLNLANGLAAMEIMPGGNLTTQAPKMYTYGVAPYPLTPVLSQRIPLTAWVRAAAIYSESKNVEAAWRFIKFLMTDAYEIGEFDLGGRKTGWNEYRGITYKSWQNYAQYLARELNLTHSPAVIGNFLAEGIASYTRVTAASNALMGGGQTIHSPNGPLFVYLRDAHAGKIPVEQALLQAEAEARIILSDIHKDLQLK